jgi:hypothetical protein
MDWRQDFFNSKRPPHTSVQLNQYNIATERRDFYASKVVTATRAVVQSIHKLCLAREEAEAASFGVWDEDWILSEKNRAIALQNIQAGKALNLKEAESALEVCKTKRLACVANLDAANSLLRIDHSHDPSRASFFALFNRDILTLILQAFFSTNQFLDFQHLCMCCNSCAAAGRLIIANPRISSSLFSRFFSSCRTNFEFKHIQFKGAAYLLLSRYFEPNLVIIPELPDKEISVVNMTYKHANFRCTLILYYRHVRGTFHLLKGHIGAFSLFKGLLSITSKKVQNGALPMDHRRPEQITAETMHYKALTINHSPAVEIIADHDVEILSSSNLLVNMDPFDCSALLFFGSAYRNEDGAIKMKLIFTTNLTHPHPHSFTLICRCVTYDDNCIRLRLSNNMFAT